MSGSLDHTAALDLVERHFAGTIAASDEARLRAHLGECESCSAAYARFRLVSLVDPAAPSAKERLGAALGLAPRRPRFTLAVPGLAAALAAAAIVFVVARVGDGDGFRARGGGAPTAPALAVFHVVGGSAAPVSGPIAPGAELAFSYTNPAGRSHLLIFGVDEHHHVHWYHPAWTDPAATPVAVAAKQSVAPVELPEAIRHELDGGSLVINAVLVDRAVSVTEIEAAVRGGRAPLVDAADIMTVPLAVRSATP